MDIEHQAFVFRLDHRLAAAKENGTIGVGWSRARDMEKHKDWGAFKHILREAYPDYYADSERALGNAAGSFWRFIFTMKKGDYAVLPTPDSGFHIAVIDGDVFYDEKGVGDDFAWKRPAKWLTQTPIPRSFAHNELQMRMKARQTCVEANDLIAEIMEVQTRTKPVDFSDDVMRGAYEPVAKALLSSLNDRGLEELVSKLATASGATSVVLAKNSGQDGDADVLATYDLKIGKQDASVRVAYQIKQHTGESDETGIEQLRQRMDFKPASIDRGVFVTTAKTINEKSRELAREYDFIVLTQKELVEWILMTGLNALGS